MTSLPLFGSVPDIRDRYKKNADVVFFCGDTNQFLRDLPDKEVKLIITSPPYNLGKAYEDKVALHDYLESQRETIAQLLRVLRQDGSLCWQVGNYVDKGEVFPLDILYYSMFKDMGLHLRNRIIWRFEHGLHASLRFSGRYETILWFTKTRHYTFNLDSVRVPSKYPGKRHYKGPNKGKPSCNPMGKNPSDYWEVVKQDWEEEVWNIPNVKCNHPEKTSHPCQFPVELVERCVLALTDPGDIVLDPYAGVGSSLIAALKHSRKAYGAEKEADYVAEGAARIKAFYNGTLRLRELGKPVYTPSGREKVSRPPEEWGEGTQGRLLEEQGDYGCE
ncbi:MAG: Modification methylase RsrI [Chloroflexi bacterium ADurb.Bin360]|nr:MAG: Modification methylase RsrI [Chloroflexi bacterium ADurb.Bin360]